MAEIEYVARVVIERVERKETPRGVTRSERIIREKGEVASFVIRADNLPSLRLRVGGMLDAAFPTPEVKGEPEDIEEEPFDAD